MYGTVNHTTEELRIHTVYTEGGFINMATLASIVKPTVLDPFRSLTIKWVLKENPGFIPTSLVRLRDTLYLESTGIVTTRDGERIGYKLFHSVQVPGIHELTEFRIVRANISFCYLYQQVAPKVVSVFMKSVMNVFGSVPASLTALNASESLVTTWKFTVHCAEMKKLMWLVRSAKSQDTRPRPPTASTCGLCQRALKATSGAICCACCGRVCSRCYVRKTLSFILPHKPNTASPLKLVYCTQCLLRATQASSFDVAVQDVRDGAAAVRLPDETLLRQTWLSCSSSRSK